MAPKFIYKIFYYFIEFLLDFLFAGYYTTDGTTQSVTNGKKLCSNSYGQAAVSSGTTVKAIAVRSCFTNSEVVSYKVS